MKNIQNTLYDSVVVGGGPAGLSAAIYLARFNRSVLVIDREHGGRWSTHEINENYFGFPHGISSIALRNRGVRQAKLYGTEFTADTIVNICKDQHLFTVFGEKSQYKAKTVIVATGVSDRFLPIHHFNTCLGKSIFWCITCDGHKTIGKKVLISGDIGETMETTMQFLDFTKHVALLAAKKEIDEKKIKECKEKNISLYFGTVKKIIEKEGYISKVITSEKETIPVDFLFYIREAIPNTSMLKELGVLHDRHGYILTDIQQRTRIEGLYAAGDVTKINAHQIVSAAHEGSTAAQVANYFLYKPFQRLH